MVIGVHMCRGNFKGKYLAEGGYERIAGELFERAAVDHFLLEYDTPRAGDFAPLRLVPRTKGVVLGLVSSKTPALEVIDLLRGAWPRRRARSIPTAWRSARNAASPARWPATRSPRPTSG